MVFCLKYNISKYWKFICPKLHLFYIKYVLNICPMIHLSNTLFVLHKICPKYLSYGQIYLSFRMNWKSREKSKSLQLAGGITKCAKTKIFFINCVKPFLSNNTKLYRNFVLCLIETSQNLCAIIAQFSCKNFRLEPLI